MALLGLVDDLRRVVTKLRWKPSSAGWVDYYDTHSSAPGALDAKKTLVAEFIESARPTAVWEVGANIGHFSRLASDRGSPTVAFDSDPAAVELNYREVRSKGEKQLLPLVLDLTNPSPNLGWDNEERASIFDRGPTDMILALAVIHHLAISNNVPLEDLARFFSRLCSWLVIEFVPKNDPQVARLLANRKDIFADYSTEAFEQAFAKHFTIRRVEPLPDSGRTLYMMARAA
jgi:ribosomal protein L11 methylase PrmA